MVVVSIFRNDAAKLQKIIEMNLVLGKKSRIGVNHNETDALKNNEKGE